MKLTRIPQRLLLTSLILCIGLQSFLSSCTDSTGTSITPATKQDAAKESNQETASAEALTEAGPKAGKWVATVSNGYKGDQITFTVSADGKRIENVEFKGYWRSRSHGIETLVNLDPPKPFIINKDNFSAVQQEEKAGMWWEFIGHFTSATTAEGTYRCSFAGGENDTYKLKWTAKRAG